VPLPPRLVGRPSSSRLSMAKPRALKLPDSPTRSPFCTTRPVTFCTAWSSVVRPSTSICSRVSTLTDCGVSRSERLSRVAVLALPEVIEPVPSVVSLASALAVTRTSARSTPAAPVASGVARST